jgi:lipopolysaccharide transport system ATP-binding protein
MDAYLTKKAARQGETVWPDLDTAPGNERVRLTAVRALQDGQITSDADMAKPVEVQIEYRVFTEGCSYGSSIHLLDRMGTCILATFNGPSATIGRDPWALKAQPPGRYCCSCYLPGNFLNEGCYLLNVFVTDGAQAVAVALEVLNINAHDTGAMRGEYQGVWIGLLRPKLAWKTRAFS